MQAEQVVASFAESRELYYRPRHSDAMCFLRSNFVVWGAAALLGDLTRSSNRIGKNIQNLKAGRWNTPGRHRPTKMPAAQLRPQPLLGAATLPCAYGSTLCSLRSGSLRLVQGARPTPKRHQTRAVDFGLESTNFGADPGGFERNPGCLRPKLGGVTQQRARFDSVRARFDQFRGVSCTFGPISVLFGVVSSIFGAV